MAARLVLLSGVEDALRRQALRELKARMGGDDFDTQVFIAGEAPPAEWLAACSTAPFLSERRTVIVRNLLRLGSPSETFSDPKASLGGLPESGRLVLVADEESASDYRASQKQDSLRKAWEAAVKGAGGEIVEFRFDTARAKTELLARAGEAGKKLSPAGAALLLEMTGLSLSRAVDELEKVVFYVGDAEVIRESDIEAAVVPSREWNVFKLADSILEGNAGQALAQLRTLSGSALKAEGAAMQNIFPNLSRSLRLIWQARAFLEAKSSTAQPNEAALAAMPEEGGLLKATDFQRNKAMAAARKLSFSTLAECLEIVARTDARLKGLEPGHSATDTLERMVLEMVRAVRPRTA